MERLTDRGYKNRAFMKEPVLDEEQRLVDIIDRLAAYEDTGLTPKQIRNALDVNDIMPELNLSTDELLELNRAKLDGRLVVLPCKVGDTVWVIGEKRIILCEIDEAYLDDKWGLEYLVSFDCDSDCDGCPFNNWHQDYSGEYSCDGEYGQGTIVCDDFGKTVFLTIEEAEAAMAGKGCDEE